MIRSAFYNRRYVFYPHFFISKQHFSTLFFSTKSTANLSHFSETATDVVSDNIGLENEVPSEIILHKIGDLKAMGFCHWTPVGFLQQCLEYIHVFTGLPWWASIAALTIVIRFSMMPLLIGMIRNLSALSLIHPQVQEHMKALKEAQLEGDMLEQAKRTRSIQELFKEYQVNPLKSLAMPFIQIPVFISFYLACSHMAALPVPELKYGGLGWFSDLTVKDSYFILPFLNSSLMFINLELGSEVGSSASANTSRKMKNFFRAMILLTPLFTMNFQSAIFCYWITSNIFSLGQGMVLRSPAIRRSLNLPPLRPKVKLEQLSDGSANSEGFKSSFTTIVEGVKNAHRQAIEVAQSKSKKSNGLHKNDYLRPVDKTLEAYMLRKKEKYKAKQNEAS
ncbi:uncharacterized protein T551_00126 [Pneumocystis jirovecii RU7]|nr:uncharacterized protein T551_00126 [Pneumocystis jirovecii RU7]KTW32641.1 hypothetical protein T551_00126 [Pneumocystis jirovecii RU7]